MSYIVVKVYSFECDFPGCDVSNTDIVAPRDLRDALRQLRATEHWTVRDGRQFCTKHR
jgi:hypothetical protein